MSYMQSLQYETPFFFQSLVYMNSTCKVSAHIDGGKFEKENSSNKSLTKAGAGGFCPAIKSCTGVVVGSPGQYRICSLNEYFVE